MFWIIAVSNLVWRQDISAAGFAGFIVVGHNFNAIKSNGVHAHFWLGFESIRAWALIISTSSLEKISPEFSMVAGQYLHLT